MDKSIGNGTSPKRSTTGFWQNLSSNVSNKIGAFFYRLGFFFATHPWYTIFVSFLLVGILSLGFLRFHNEKNPLKLWIPTNSKFVRDTEWLMESFEEGTREQMVLITAPDVLDSKVLGKLAYINEEITKLSAVLKNGTKFDWNDICFKIPIIAGVTSRRKRDTLDNESEETNDDSEFSLWNIFKTRPSNPVIDLPTSLYCGIVNALPKGCFQHNLIDLWKYDRNVIGNLTKEEILHQINVTTKSPVTGHETSYTHLLGGVQRNSNNEIFSAKSILSYWMVYVNFSDVDHDKTGNSAGTEDIASEETLAWEEEYLALLERLKIEMEDNSFKMYYSAGRSYGDISAAVMFQDMDKVFIGAFIMFVFMQIVLSKFSWLELRITLGSAGLLCVGFAFLSCVGICSVLGISYGPVHTSLPFLMIGLGVDDIFVMMACWRKVQETNKGPIPERIGFMLKHAGVSITVTSVTDIIAFTVGSTTVIPSLKSFCLYAAVGTLMTYLFAVTFFVAVFTLDEQRILARRNAVFPCIVHKKESKLCFDKHLMDKFLRGLYSKFFLTKGGKLLVLLVVVCFTGINLKGMLNLEQKFDPNWFIPESTYLSKFLSEKKAMYPNMGYEAGIYMGRLNYSQELPKLIEMVEIIENRTDILHNVNSWIEPFNNFVKIYFEKDMRKKPLTDKQMRKYLSKFLFSSDGGKFQENFRFDGKLECEKSTPPIKVASIYFKFRKFENRQEFLPAMHSIERIVESTNLTSGDGFSTVWGKVFANWITDEIIDVEVFRNIGLALICVMGCTGVLIVDIQVCFWIFICVLLTLINVCGGLYYWGLTIDLTSCIGLQLAVGLCVDYAAHIGHTFLTISKPTRNERSLETVLHIGAAVLYGGGSTLLALAMLSGSEAYTFIAFFKIFVLVISFGLFHGLVFLPVVLSIIGPKPYKMADEKHEVEMITGTNNGTEKHYLNGIMDEESEKLNS